MQSDWFKYPYFLPPLHSKTAHLGVQFISELVFSALLSKPTSLIKLLWSGSWEALVITRVGSQSSQSGACRYHLKQVVFCYSFKHRLFWFCFSLTCSSFQSAGSSSYWLWKWVYSNWSPWSWSLLCWNSLFPWEWATHPVSFLALSSIIRWQFPDLHFSSEPLSWTRNSKFPLGII